MVAMQLSLVMFKPKSSYFYDFLKAEAVKEGASPFVSKTQYEPWLYQRGGGHTPYIASPSPENIHAQSSRDSREDLAQNRADYSRESRTVSRIKRRKTDIKTVAKMGRK